MGPEAGIEYMFANRLATESPEITGP